MVEFHTTGTYLTYFMNRELSLSKIQEGIITENWSVELKRGVCNKSYDTGTFRGQSPRNCLAGHTPLLPVAKLELSRS